MVPWDFHLHMHEVVLLFNSNMSRIVNLLFEVPDINRQFKQK